MKTELKEILFHVAKELNSEMLDVNTISSTEYGIYAYTNGNGQRRGKPTLLNTCSNVYELVPNAEIFPVVEKLLNDANIPYDVTYKMIDFSRFYADYEIKDFGVSVGNKNDKIYPILRIEHSYNGLLKYKLTFGWFRMICSNGLTVPVEGKEDQNITIIGKHTKQILASLETLIDKLTFFTANAHKFTEKFETLAGRFHKNWKTRVENLIEATGIGKRGFDQIVSKVEEESKMLSGGEVNDWIIYNAFNFHIYNARTSEGKEYATAPNLRHDQDRKVFTTLYNNPNKIKVKKEKAE